MGVMFKWYGKSNISLEVSAGNEKILIVLATNT